MGLAAIAGVGVLAIALSIWFKPPPRWSATHATQLHVNGWEADIPEGWRDLHELNDPPKGLEFPVPGSRTIIDDKLEYPGRIDVIPFVRTAGEDGCNGVADIIRGQLRNADASLDNVSAATFAGDPGCLMHLRVGRDLGLFLIRSHAMSGIAVRCLGNGADLDGGSACDKIIYGLRPAK